MIIKVKRLTEDAALPWRAGTGNAGFDIFSNESTLLIPKSVAIISTGIALEIPDGYYVQLQDRSSLGKLGIKVMGGVIDSSYRGEIKVMLAMVAAEKQYVIEKGERICQGILHPVIECKFEFSDSLTKTVRGTGGFGSTGK